MNDPPRFLIYTDSLTSRSRLEDLLQNIDSHDRPVFHEWEAFAQAAGKGERAVAFVVPRLTREQVRRLTRFRKERRQLPAVLVTADTPENLKALNRLPDFDELLVGEELATLPDVLGRLEKHSLLLEAAALIESMEHLHPDLRATLARACRRREPARAVEELAKILGGTRQELWRLWRSSGRAGTTPHAFIDWLLLAHAVAIRIRGESNRELAKRLHVAPATLASATKRYLKGGAKFADDDKVDPSAIIAGLREILQRTDLTRGGQI